MPTNNTYSEKTAPKRHPLPQGLTAQQVRDDPKMVQTAIFMDLGLTARK